MIKRIAIISLILLSCGRNNDLKRKEIDTSIKKKAGLSLGQEFENLISKETKTLKDTNLIVEYKKILGKNDIFDLYILDRIRTINEVKNNNNNYNILNGSYIVKNSKDYKHISFSKIKIVDDFCILYKNKKIIDSIPIKIINSSNKYVKYKFILKTKNRSYLFKYTVPNVLYALPNFCMDCEEIELRKIVKSKP